MINQIEDFLNQKKSSNLTIESMFIDRLFSPENDECFVLFEYKTKLSEADFNNYFETITRIKCTFLVEKVFNDGILSILGFTNLSKLSKRNKINQVIEIDVDNENISQFTLNEKEYILLRFNSSLVQNLNRSSCSILCEFFKENDESQEVLLDFFNTSLNIEETNDNLKSLIRRDTISPDLARDFINISLLDNEQLVIRINRFLNLAEPNELIQSLQVDFTIQNIGRTIQTFNKNEEEISEEIFFRLDFSTLTRDELVEINEFLREGFINFSFRVQVELKLTGTIIRLNKRFAVSSIVSNIENESQQVTTTLNNIDDRQIRLNITNSGINSIPGSLREIILSLKQDNTITIIERYNIESDGFPVELDYFDTFRNSSRNLLLTSSDPRGLLDNIENFFISYVLNNNTIISHRLDNNANLIDQNFTIDNIVQEISNSYSLYAQGNLRVTNRQNNNFLFSLINSQLQDLGYSESIDNLNSLIDKIVFIVTPTLRRENDNIQFDSLVISKNNQIIINEDTNVIDRFDVSLREIDSTNSYNTIDSPESNILIFGLAINSIKNRIETFENSINEISLKYEISFLPNLSELNADAENRQTNILKLTNYIVENGFNVSYTDAEDIATNLIDINNPENLLRFLKSTRINASSIINSSFPEQPLLEPEIELVDASELFSISHYDNEITLAALSREANILDNDIRNQFSFLIPTIEFLSYTNEAGSGIIENFDVNKNNIYRTIKISYDNELNSSLRPIRFVIRLILQNNSSRFLINKNVEATHARRGRARRNRLFSRIGRASGARNNSLI